MRFDRKLRAYFVEYCQCTSIHGFRYLGEKRTYIDLGWWLVIFLLCLSCCAYFITMVYQKWESSPIIVSFATQETPIYKIPFPAVTICPESKAVKKLYSHSTFVSKLKHHENLTENEYRDVSYMNLLCDVNITEELDEQDLINSSLNATFDNYYYSDNKFFNFMFNVVPHFHLSMKCRWMNQDYDCEDLFEIIVTDEGVCATFNMLGESQIYRDNVYFGNIPSIVQKNTRQVQWTLDDGYGDHEGVETFPRRALLAGAKNSLDVVILEEKINMDETCKLSFQGFKVSLHTPSRVPRPSQQYFRLPLNQVVIGAVQPVMITTSDTVKEFKPEKRECYFENERPLKYFKVYTQRNCQLECLSDFTYEWCLCVSFFMPRENGTDICGTLNKPCMEQAEEVLQKGHLRNILDVKRRKKNSTSENVAKVPNCDCLPLCTDLSYDIETSASVWDWRDFMSVIYPEDAHMIDMKNVHLSKLIIYFKNNQFVTSKRHELYGPTDFLANFGGLLGLFTGFSILSLMEIIYFLTVRIICNVKLYGNWSGREKDLEKNA